MFPITLFFCLRQKVIASRRSSRGPSENCGIPPPRPGTLPRSSVYGLPRKRCGNVSPKMDQKTPHCSMCGFAKFSYWGTKRRNKSSTTVHRKRGAYAPPPISRGCFLLFFLETRILWRKSRSSFLGRQLIIFEELILFFVCIGKFRIE